ncbi:MAG: DnaA ATPase domain-containing protein, partial [Planctomycetota bacterium]
MQDIITDESSRTVTSQISEINEVLSEQVGPQKFRIWFKNSTNMTLADGYLKVGVPNLFIASWIEKHFSKEITRAVRTVTGTEAKITFSIDPELSGHQRRTRMDSKASVALNREKVGQGKIVAKRSGRKKLKLSLETFVVGSSNELAYNAAKVVVNEQQSPFNPLFIHGGYGVGKTHLLQGICNAVCEKR